ncbi:TPA: hypothetical protein QCU24_002461 [Bacillus cereus]|nr:hypothetical protein [Bacillus cereus]
MIKWGEATVSILLTDIITIVEGVDEEEGVSLRIGTPYGNNDRILIKTHKVDYMIFVKNKNQVLEELTFFLNNNYGFITRDSINYT